MTDGDDDVFGGGGEDDDDDRQCTCNRNIETQSRNRNCRGKEISITFSECVSIA